MIRHILLLLCMVGASVAARAEADCSLSALQAIELPVMQINTVDSVMPTCDYVDHPPGCIGHSTTNATKVPGRMVITMLADTLYDSGEYLDGESGMTIKITGNTSALKDQKPYKIKLQKKADLLMRGDPACMDREWRLLRDDRTFNTIVGFKVNELMGLQWTPRWQYCNVVINGEYQGLYLLIETVKRNRGCRLDVDKSGFIVERDAYWWNEDRYFNTPFFDQRFAWTFKYPDGDEVTEEQQGYIQDYITRAEQSIKQSTYVRYIDVESFASWLLAHDILGTWDSGGSNLYVTKRDSTDGSRLEMGCLWDFDSSREMGVNTFSRYHMMRDFYFVDLLENKDATFRRAYRGKWDEVKATLLSDIDGFVNGYAASMSRPIYQSRALTAQLYGYSVFTTYTSAIFQVDWMKKHLPELDEIISSIDISAIDDIRAEEASDNRTFNLHGIEVPDDTRGLVIRNRRLVLQP